MYSFYLKSDAMSFPSVQNLTCCEVFNSKSGQTKKFNFKIWCLLEFYFQNLMRCFPWIQHLTRCIFLYSKSDMSEYYNSKFNALSFSYAKSDAVNFSSIQNLTRCKISTQNLTPFFSKSDALYCFAFKHWHAKKNLISKSNVLTFFKYRIWQLVKLSSQNLMPCFFCFKIRRVVFLSVWNLTCNKL